MKFPIFFNGKIFILFIISCNVLFAHGPGGVGNTQGTEGQPPLALWLDASQLSLSENADVSIWTDLSGHGRHATQTTTNNMPIFVPNVIGGHSVVRFRPTSPNRTETFLNYEGDHMIGTPYALFAIAANRVTGEQHILGGSNNDNNAERNLRFGWLSDSQFRLSHIRNNNHHDRNLSNNTLNTFTIFSAIQNNNTDPFGRAIFQNGSRLGSIDSRIALLETYSDPYIGRLRTSYSSVDLAEIIQYTQALNAAQRLIVENYLSVKYGIGMGSPDNQIYSHANYKYDLVGIGHTNNGIKHSRTSGNGGGLYLAEYNNSLNEDNEFVFAAHNNTPHNTTTTQIPADIPDRWSRDYYLVRRQGGIVDNGTTDIRLGFHFGESGVAATENYYRLLYRASLADDYIVVSGLYASIIDDIAWFTIESTQLNTGFYTIGRTEETAITWYSHLNAEWSDPDTWTTDPSGTLLTPLGSNSIPGPLDRVVILESKNVVVDINNIKVQSLEIKSSATLDFGVTTGHDMGAIRGEGRIRLAADNFPAGDDFAFVHAPSSTVEYYGVDNYTLTTPRTYSNVVVNLSASHKILTLRTDYQINGSLVIEQGTLKINDNSNTAILQLNVNKNFTIQSNGRLTTGTANTIGTFSPASPPPAGQYHNIYHQLRIGGDMTVAAGGQAHFSNRTGPIFNAFANNGAITVTFTGTSNNTVLLEGRANFYNLVVNKGTDQTFVLEINSAHQNNFNLYGPNNMGRIETSPFSAANSEVRKALWIRNGTLKLTGNMHIPSLSEGNVNTINGDFTIGATAGLWIASPGVTVYTTLSDAANIDNAYSGTGYTNTSFYTALTVYGKFQIDDGFLGTRHSAGLIFWEDASATVEINGGIVDVAQFRSTQGGAGGKTSLLITGGHLRVRANNSLQGESGGEVDPNYPIFGIIHPSGVFNMSGGEITILAGSREDDNNTYGNNGLYIASSVFNVSGGTINLNLNGTSTFFVETTANLWNLNITRRSTSGTVNVRFTRELKIGNDILIGDHTVLHPRRTDTGAHFDLFIGRNLILGETVGSNALYSSDRAMTSGNTTYFTGNQNSEIRVMNSQESTFIRFWNLVINKNQRDNEVIIVSEGRPKVDIDAFPTTIYSPLEIYNSLRVVRGILHYNGFALNFDGSQTVENQSGIGKIGDPGFLVFSNLTGQQTILTPLNSAPVFGNLVVNNSSTAGVALTGGATVTIGNLGLRRGIFNIGSQGIIVEKNILNLFHNTSPNFSATKLILTAGKHSDGGITRRIEANGSYLFPLGINTSSGDGIRYTPALQTFSDITSPGYSQINNVDNELPTLNPDNDHSALKYYWRLRNTGFSAEPFVINQFEFFDLPVGYRPGNDDPSIWSPGKIVNLVRFYNLGDIDWDNPTNRLMLTFSGFQLEPGEFTAGHSNRFSGEVNVFFSRLRGYHNNQRLWTDASSWTTLSELKELYGDNVLNESEKWHLSSNTASSITPTTGDLVVIGWVPWDDPDEEKRGHPHNIRVEDTTVNSAEVIFNPMLDSLGQPAPRNSWDTYFFRPTLTLSGATARVNTPIISGEGTIRNRQCDPDFTHTDIGDFAAMDSSYVVYEVFGTPTTLNNVPLILPNLIVVSDDWGDGNKIAVIPKNLRINGNLEIWGNTILRLSDEADGDFTIYGDLSLQRAYRESTSYTHSRLEFQNTGTSRTITVFGNICTEGTAGIYVLNPNTTVVEHTLNLYGNYTQNAESIFAGAGAGVLRLATAANQDRIILNALGEKNQLFDGTHKEAFLHLYRLTVDKGNSPACSLHISLPMARSTDYTSIYGPIDQQVKSVNLLNGTLILDNNLNDINLSSGSNLFEIPSTAALVLKEGQISSDNDFIIDGALRLEKEGRAVLQRNLLFTASGNSLIEIHDNALLRVNGQLRSPISNDGGVLRYRQTGGEVLLGIQFADTPSRGVLEVMNPGSSFEFKAGEITIVRPQSGTPSRAALFLNPSQSTIGENAVIRIGAPGIGSGMVIDVNSHVPLANLTVEGNNNTARLRTNSLTLNNDLTIASGNSFTGTYEGNKVNLFIKGDIHNPGNPVLGTDSIVFNGSEQNIYGSITVNHMVMNAQTHLTLNDADITVQGNLYINRGIIYDNGNTLLLTGDDVHNHATFISAESNSGGLSLSGANNQRLFGNGTFGRLEIDKSAGTVTLQGNLSLEKNLHLASGRLNLRNYRLTLGYDSEITKPDDTEFEATRMILTNGIYSDGGLGKRIGVKYDSDTTSFTFPMGVVDKYTPVTVKYVSNTNPGLITVSPNNGRHRAISVVNTDVLQYHWWVETQGLNNFNGMMTFQYVQSDVIGLENEYIPAFLWFDPSNPDYGWARFTTDWVNTNDNRFWINFNGANNFTGDFTAGTFAHIPIDVPLYISRGSGLWTNVDNWRHGETGNSPTSTPSGVRILIEPGHIIQTGGNTRIAYQTDIQGTLEIGSTYDHNLGLVSGIGTFSLASNQIPAGNYQAFMTNPESTIDFGGTGSYTLTFPSSNPPISQYQNLVVRGSGEKTTSNEHIAVRGNLLMDGNATFKILNYLQLSGNITKTPSAQVRFSDYIDLRGMELQTISGDFTGENKFFRLWMRNSTGVEVMNDVEVQTLLYLQYGIIHMRNNSTLIHNGSYNAESFTDRFASWIDGRLRRSFNNSAEQLFMVGKNGNPRYVILRNISHEDGAKPWSVEYFPEDPNLIGTDLDAELFRISKEEYWKIEGPSPGSARIQVEYGPQSLVSNEPEHLLTTRIAEWSDGKWNNRGGSATASLTEEGAGSVTASIASTFSTKYFTIATTSADNPLPIELLFFTAHAETDHILLEWATASEINNDFFTIERSRDGYNYEIIAVVASKAPGGFSNQVLRYSMPDKQPMEGMNYYRLKQTDFDGSYEYSKPVGVYFQAQDDVIFQLYPNPNRGNAFQIALSGLRAHENITLQIADLFGKGVQSTELFADESGAVNHYFIPSGKLSPGVYVVVVSGVSGRFTVRKVVR